MDPLAPAWRPTDATIANANLTGLMRERDLASFDDLHRWSVDDPADFWGVVIDRLGIVFSRTPDRILEGPAADPTWLAGARMNIVDSCFTAADDTVAVVFSRDDAIHRMTYGELRTAVAGFAAGLGARGIGQGDRVAIAMAMTVEAVVAYLAVVALGGVVVSIADSFAAEEIGTRLELTEPVLLVTQDRIIRAGKELPMYEKVVASGAPSCVVVDTGGGIPLRDGDLPFSEMIHRDVAGLVTVQCDPSDHTNILFSSGTTGAPKAIPWTHLTPIKAAMDGRYHQDIHPGDVVAWPTNLGWMMGPWLIYASLINDAALALYDDVPTERGFIDFVADARVTMLGLVPSIVAAWRAGGVLDDGPWSELRVVSSTGEASVPDDYAWLMERGGVPVIEYCGGTEIGGGYISGTVLHDAIPATFSTPTLGIDVRILDDEGEASDVGELFLVPPSIGMSQVLLNRDHHSVYYEGVPAANMPLRRHGDQLERLPNGYYRALGRVDDTMNLGGIKVSSAEIERVVGVVDGVVETAAIAIPPPGGGPSRLVVYVVPQPGAEWDTDRLHMDMQAAIKEHLNPLFRLDRVVVIDELPRTASAKVMRRKLRAGLA